MSLRSARLLAALLLSAVVGAGCTDTAPTGAERITAPTSRPAHAISAQEAFATADQYDERQPLAPFGVSEWEFNENPEIVTDQQFSDYWESRMTDWEAYQIEQDALKLEDHLNSCGGYHSGTGGGGGWDEPVQPFGYDRCDDLLRECFKRCKRIRSLKIRGGCYTACFAAYALCRANV